MEDIYSSERKTNLYKYHEFVANGLSAVVDGYNNGHQHNARQILIFLYEYGKINAGEKVDVDDIKMMKKMTDEELSIESLSALKRAGLAPVQDEYRNSFYKTIVKKKRGGI